MENDAALAAIGGMMQQARLRCEIQALHAHSYAWALACSRRDPVLAEDVLQRVYVKVLSGKAVYREQGPFKTWLFGVIRMTARDELRREVLRRMSLTRYFSRGHRQSYEDPEINDDESAAQLGEMLKQLPARQRQILHLVFYEDLSLSDAAEVMNVSIGSARTHYDRGKKAIRRLIEETKADERRPGTRSTPCVVL